MAAHVRSVLTEIFAALRIDHSAGTGVYDLSTTSGTPRVVLADGDIPQGYVPPVVLISGPQARPEYDDAPLGQYGTRVTFVWWGYAPPVSDITTEGRALAAADLANDVITALQDAHHDPAFPVLHSLTELLVTLEEIFGDGPGIPKNVGLAFGSISYLTERTRGI